MAAILWQFRSGFSAFDMMFLKILGSLGISFLCFYLAARDVHWHELKTTLSQANAIPIVAGLVASLLTFYLRAFRWKIILQPFQKTATFLLLRLQIGALFINSILPLRMGDLSRAYWAGHKMKLSKSTMLATIFLERIMDIASIAAIATLLLFLMGFYKFNSILNLRNVLGSAAALLALTFPFLYFRKKLDKNFLIKKINNVLPKKATSVLENFLSGLKIIQNKTELIKVALLSLLIWCSDITILLIFSRSLKINLSWPQAGLTIAGLILGAMIPAPGGVATYEGGGMSALLLMKIEKSLALSFILLLHAAQLFWVTLLGVPVLLLEGFKPEKLLENNETK